MLYTICILHPGIGFQVLYSIYSILEMATLTFKPYVPKPPKNNIRKPISKSIARQPSSLNKSFQIDSNDKPIKVPPALGRGADNNNWCQMSIGDSKTIVQDAQVSRDDLVGTQGIYIFRPSPLRPLYLSYAMQQSQ